MAKTTITMTANTYLALPAGHHTNYGFIYVNPFNHYNNVIK